MSVMCESIFLRLWMRRTERRESWLFCLGWSPKEWDEQICKGTLSFTFKTWDMAEVHSILANWMVLLHFGKVIWTQWMQRCAHFMYTFGIYVFHQCSETVWQKGMPVFASCILSSLLLTNIWGRNKGMKQVFEDKTKENNIPALLIFVGFKMF